MKITTKIEKACSTDKQHQPLMNPYFDGQKLYASDGHVLAVIPAEELDLQDLGAAPGYIPIQAILASRRLKDSFLKNTLLIHDAVKVELPDGSAYPRNPGNETYPSIVLRDDAFALEAVNENHISIYFDAEKLWNLVQALGIENNVRMDIPIKIKSDEDQKIHTAVPVLGGIKISPSKALATEKKAWGILMPLNGGGK